MRRFFVLLKKELRELITPQTFVPLLIVILVFVVIGQSVGSTSDGEGSAFPIQVFDGDHTQSSALVVEALKQGGFAPVMADSWVGSAAEGAQTLAMDLPKSAGNVVVAIPQGFEQGLLGGKPQQIDSWAVLRSLSFMGSKDVSALKATLSAVNQSVALQVAKMSGTSVPAEMLQQPIKVTEHVVIGTRQAKTSADQVMSFVSQQTTFIPIVMFVVIIFAAQMIGVAIATEKENKTLETLLSYPISRASLVTSKMLAAGLVALVTAGVYMAGMRSYMNGVMKGFAGEGASAKAAAASEAVMRQLGLTLGATDYVMLGLSLFAAILVALSMAIILGAFAESVKSVQALLTPLMVMLLVPYFLTLFFDIGQLSTSLRVIISAIPFTYPFLAGPNLFLENPGAVWFGIAYQMAWFAVLVVVAARIFSSDRILTMKLSLGRKRRAARTAG